MTVFRAYINNGKLNENDEPMNDLVREIFFEADDFDSAEAEANKQLAKDEILGHVVQLDSSHKIEEFV